MADHTFAFLYVLGIIYIVIPSFVCGDAAKSKGYSALSFFLLSLFFTPIVGFLAVIAFRDKNL